MTCYTWEGLSKPLALIDASFVGAKRQLIISSCIVQLHWDCGIEFFHKLGWSGFSLAIFAICWWFPWSVLGILSKVILFGGSCVSLCCGLCEERGMLRFLRILGRCLRWCETCFIYMFLFGSIVLTFLNNFLWVWFSLSFECNST